MIRALIIYYPIALVIIGLLCPLLQRFGVGKLPGDVVFKKGKIKIYIPLVSTILIFVCLVFLLLITGLAHF